MSMYILGISAFYHDSSACLLKDGVIVAAAAEERFTRIKHDNSFPSHAVAYCLESQGITSSDISYVAYYEKPILKFDRIFQNNIKSAPFGFWHFKKSILSWVSKKLWVASIIKKKLKYKGEIKYCQHHESHAASAYYTSPFTESAFLIIDGVGEKATTTYGICKGNKIQTLGEIQFPHSLGLLYTAFTYYCGFKVNSGEYKLMGLAPYGTPKFADIIRDNLINLNKDGSYTLNMKYFQYESGLRMINNEFCKLFGQAARKPESEMTDFYKDMAASIQLVLEEGLIHIANGVKERTKQSNLCYSGGVALNCVANAKLKSEGIFDEIWIQPASGDSGTCIGAALQVHYQALENEYIDQPDQLNQHSYLGPSYTNIEVQEVLKTLKVPYITLNDSELATFIANKVNEKAVVGWFQGRMEFGPRALGNRSILASPLFADMQQHLNLKIKKREGFRPFAPIILREKAQEWFDSVESSSSMLYTYQCKQMDKIPSCVHVDGSSRVQTLDNTDNPLLHQLISEFDHLSGCPVLINTSFNERGEPVVCSPLDALKCFINTEMDIVVLGNIVINKEELKEDYTALKSKYEAD